MVCKVLVRYVSVVKRGPGMEGLSSPNRKGVFGCPVIANRDFLKILKVASNPLKGVGKRVKAFGIGSVISPSFSVD